MTQSLDLVNRLVLTAPSQSELARSMGLQRTTISKALERESVSPTLAGLAAARLGEDPREAIITAVLEAEKNTTARERLRRALQKARNA